MNNWWNESIYTRKRDLACKKKNEETLEQAETTTTTTTTTVLRSLDFFWDYPGETVPEK